MKVKVPQKIRVGGHNYSIVLNEAIEDEGLKGAHNPRKLTIEINPIRPKEQWGATLIHEFVHAINRVYLNSRLCEDDADSIGQGWYQIFEELGIEFDCSLIEES